MTHIAEYNPSIYPYLVWVLINDSPQLIAEHFNGYDGEEIQNLESDTSSMAAFAMPVTKKDDSSYGVILYFRSKESMTYELVAHESTHAAKYLFKHIGAEIEPFEPFEFLVGWIAGCCEKSK
ncbi:MAG: hypothetical protein ACRCUJ_07855 [Phocaeicola sp.]